MNDASTLPRFSPRLAADAPSSLRMSEYFLIAGFWLALLLVTDPFGQGLEKKTLFKHLPLLLALAGVLFVNIGHVLFPPEPGHSAPRRWRVLAAGWPLLLLGGWVVAGSLYTRNYNGIHNTFLGMGLYMLLAVLLARVVMISGARERLVRGFLFGAIFAAIFMMLRMAADIATPTIRYHELEALTIPLAVYFALRPTRNPNGQALLVALFLLGGLVFRKNTAYLVMAVTALYLWLVHWRFRFRESPGFRRAAVAWMVVLALGGMTVTSYRAYLSGDWLPSGNPQYRLKTYETAWNNFRESPLWGSAFTASATEKFKGFQINVARGVLPSHSDVLDIAANGGVLGILLWLWAYLRAGRLAWRNVLRTRPVDDLAAAAHALACMSLTSIIVYAFNPIMLQPAKAMLLWATFGLLLGIALYRKPPPQAPVWMAAGPQAPAPAEPPIVAPAPAAPAAVLDEAPAAPADASTDAPADAPTDVAEGPTASPERP